MSLPSEIERAQSESVSPTPGEHGTVLATAEANGETERVLIVPIERIMLNPEQPRKHFDADALADLTASVKAKGILQPILVRPRGPKLQIVAGERRYRAAVGAGLEQVPVIVRHFDERETLQVGIIENLQRENLNPLEEAETYKRLIDEYGHTQESLARTVGKDRTTISNTIRLLKLPREVQVSLREGRLSQGHARALLGLSDSQRQRELAGYAESKGLSVREVERLVQQEREPSKRRRANHKPAYLEHMERLISEMIYTQVTIQERGKKGSITIDYYSIDEFERLFEILQRGSGQAFEQVVRLKTSSSEGY